MDFNEPAGWIPPQFRQLIYGELDASDIAAVHATAFIEDEHGNRRPMDLNRVRKVIGVRDTRTGQEHYNQQSTTPFMAVNIQRPN